MHETLKLRLLLLLLFTFSYSLAQLGGMEWSEHTPLYLTGKSIYYISMLLMFGLVSYLVTKSIVKTILLLPALLTLEDIWCYSIQHKTLGFLGHYIFLERLRWFIQKDLGLNIDFPIPHEPVTSWLVIAIMVVSITWVVFVLRLKI